MGEMASALAHELNQPLSAISNYMKGSRRLLAGSTDANAPKIEAALDRAAEQAIRAGDIIRRLRDFVARDASEKRVESLSKMIEEAGALGLTGAREQGVLLRFNLDPTCDLVLADRVQIQQVLVNLFRNALEAMAVSTHRELIASNTRAADDMIEIAVSDTGPGFAGDDACATCSSPFSRPRRPAWASAFPSAAPSSKPTAAGCGPKPTASGGATFRFTLPAASAKDMTDAARGKVYVIDDDAAMRDSLDFLLGSAGFNVRLFEFRAGFPGRACRTWSSAAWSRTCACRASTAWSCCDS